MEFNCQRQNCSPNTIHMAFDDEQNPFCIINNKRSRHDKNEKNTNKISNWLLYFQNNKRKIKCKKKQQLTTNTQSTELKVLVIDER